VKKPRWSSFDRFKEVCETTAQLVLADGFARCQAIADWREPFGDGAVAYLFRFKARKAPQEGRRSPAEHRTVRVRFTGPTCSTVRAEFVAHPENV
jgi:hypothetical protein